MKPLTINKMKDENAKSHLETFADGLKEANKKFEEKTGKKSVNLQSAVSRLYEANDFLLRFEAELGEAKKAGFDISELTGEKKEEIKAEEIVQPVVEAAKVEEPLKEEPVKTETAKTDVTETKEEKK